MAQYYDPREAATTFSLFAKVHGTEREKEEEESQERRGCSTESEGST